MFGSVKFALLRIAEFILPNRDKIIHSGVDLRTHLDATEKIKISCPCRGLNIDSTVIKPVALFSIN
jgi:hypothetical protein